MSYYFLAAPFGFVPGVDVPAARLDLFLESLDGSQRLELNGSTGWKFMPGGSGLDQPPMEIIRAQIPGVDGSNLQEVRVGERTAVLPIVAQAGGGGLPTHLQMMETIRRLTDPLSGQFRLVGVTDDHEREMSVIYDSGLEGAYGRDEFGVDFRRFVLTAIACDPWAYDRADRLVEFDYVAPGAAPFIGVAGGTNAIWPTALASSAVIGLGMQVLVTSEVPVYPVLELVGPMDSFTGSLSPVLPGLPEWSVEIPGGVPAGSTLRLVTDPRSRSFRLGAGDPATDPGWAGTAVLAAGSVSLGSSLRPFFPGLNVLDVVAPGGTSATRIRLSWREAHRSLW